MVACCIVSLALLIVIILVASSLSVLSYNEVGLNYSNWFKTVEEKTYYHGITFIGLGHSFLKYDIRLNTIEFSKDANATLPMIKCRTKDGLELELEASLQYRVDAESVYKIYSEYGEQDKNILTRTILDIISDTATIYSSNDLFTKRSEIQKRMKADI